MPTELRLQAEHQGDMRWIAAAGGHAILMDYPIPAGPGEGMKPLEVLLASLAGCAGNTLVLLLKRSGQPVSAMSIDIIGGDLGDLNLARGLNFIHEYLLLLSGFGMAEQDHVRNRTGFLPSHFCDDTELLGQLRNGEQTYSELAY